MHTIELIPKTMTAALFLLCMLVPQFTAAPNAQPVQDVVYLQEDVESAPLWSHSSPHVPGHNAAATRFSKREELEERAIELPSWDSIVATANEVIQAAEDGLNNIATEFDVTGKIQELESTFQTVLATTAEIRERLTELTEKGVTLDQISDELGLIFKDILVYLQQTFPPPDQAPSHEERQRIVGIVLDKAEQGLLDLARKYGMSEDGLENVRETFDLLKPQVQTLVVITGDLIEQHPIIFSALVSSAVAILIPESWILRPLLSVIGFGPYGPIKGSLAAWAQRTFWGATVEKGSLFSILQKAGMKGFRRCSKGCDWRSV